MDSHPFGRKRVVTRRGTRKTSGVSRFCFLTGWYYLYDSLELYGFFFMYFPECVLSYTIKRVRKRGEFPQGLFSLFSNLVLTPVSSFHLPQEAYIEIPCPAHQFLFISIKWVLKKALTPLIVWLFEVLIWGFLYNLFEQRSMEMNSWNSLN